MRKHLLKLSLIAGLLFPTIVPAQQKVVEVDRKKYPDYSTTLNIDPSLNPSPTKATKGKSKAAEELPLHVNNAENMYFPPVFNQDGGSCGSASRICYMFSYELAAYRNLDASKPENYYPSHFVWLHTYAPSGQGKDEFVQFVGVPSAATYGGQTYSALFGNQDTQEDDFGWMQGYDKWFEAMHNRMLKPVHFPQSIATEEGREAVKRWLWNHNGDNDFHAGGICGIGVASGGIWDYIPKTETNKEIGVGGMWYVREWGTQVDHALTIVGYDDRIEFDIDKDGIYGEKDADEVGAWIIVNSWGNTWCNAGFIYCPYAFAGSAFKNDGKPGDRTFNGDFWWPEIYKVRKDYRPLRTIKLEMEYSRRSEIALSAGVSTNLNAEMPEKSVSFVHFQYAGDGNYGNTNPAPEIPMLGRWADGKLHKEPMEFGYDLTDLSADFDRNMPLKYFFIVDTKSWAKGNGKIHKASIIDYEHDKEGIETPFDLNGEGVEIKNSGNKTIISVVVYGESYYAPQNIAFNGNSIVWQAPLRSSHQVASYNVYEEGTLVENVSSNSFSYQLENEPSGTYSVSAVYEDGTESAKISITSPIPNTTKNMTVDFKQSGFSIPNIFGGKFDQVTIEYWINPSTLIDWNQSGGPGWGTFMFHANSNGRFTAGWDTSNRCNSNASLKNKAWNHVAIVVDKNTMTIYINGNKSGSVTSSSYSGIGGFGDLTFSANGTQNAQNAKYDEIRIWNYARSQKEIFGNKNVEYTGSILPEGLIAYFKGDTIHQDGIIKMRDCVGGNHAEILNDKFSMYEVNKLNPKLTAPTDELSVSINDIEGNVYAGIPVTLSAKYSNSTNTLKWTAAGAEVEELAVANPTLTFKNTGEQTITVVALNAKGESVSATKTITVLEPENIDATFKATKKIIPAGERVTFIVNNPTLGYIYNWSMPGADQEKSTTINAAASYQAQGDYIVTLTVTAPNGMQKSESTTISVVEVAPVADFNVAPNVIKKGETTFLHDKSKYAPTQWKWHLSSTGGDYLINGQHSSFTPEKPGVYNISLEVSNGTGSGKVARERALIVCNEDSKNGLNFGNGSATLTTNKIPFVKDQRTFTIEWWMNSGRPTSFCNAIGDNEETFILKTDGNGRMHIFVNSKTTSTNPDFVIPGEWHHYAVTFSSGTATFYLDGNQIIRKSVGWAKLPELSKFNIGLSTVPFSGQIDEFRIWGTALSADEIKQYANSHIHDIKTAEEENDLVVYYSFNQNGGNVSDATSNKNDGIRNGFGPDGDAWGLSKGVFCLNFDETEKTTDITKDYLKNYKKSFSYNANKCINPNLSTRTFAINDWILENVDTNGDIITGVHVDKSKNNCFTVTTGWDKFATTITNHKAFQTITLPAGAYTFKATYDDQYEGQCGDSYIVVSENNTLADTENLDSDAIAYTKMLPKSSTCLSNSVTFVLTEETTISLGLLINMNGSLCMTIQNFSLTRSNITSMEADGADGYDLIINGSGYSSLYLPYPVEIPSSINAYCATKMDNNTVVLEMITDGTIPARTGVVIEGNPGEHHFYPSSQSNIWNSLLIGYITETEADSNTSYYEFVCENGKKHFKKIETNLLEANKAYLEIEGTTTAETIEINIVETGIQDVIGNSNVKNELYDISGRRVTHTEKGIYIQNGQKVIVR